MKPITKKELQDQLEAANARADALQVRINDTQETVTRLQSGTVTIPELAKMLNVSRDTVARWARNGLISTRIPPVLFPRILLSDLKDFLEDRAFEKGRASVSNGEEGARARKAVAEANLAEMALTEAAAKNPLVTALDARVKELEAEVFHLKDESIPPALPQQVVDALDQSVEVIDGCLAENFALLLDDSENDGFLDDPDAVVEAVKSLGILKARIRQALDADFEHHAALRIEASQQELKKVEASLERMRAEAA